MEFQEDLWKKLPVVIKKSLQEAGLQNHNEITWIGPAEAGKIIGLKSRKSMRNLRATGEVNYYKAGREYRYDRDSLNNYLLNRSALKYKSKPERTYLNQNEKYEKG